MNHVKMGTRMAIAGTKRDPKGSDQGEGEGDGVQAAKPIVLKLGNSVLLEFGSLLGALIKG
jgi:hypothetical protein